MYQTQQKRGVGFPAWALEQRKKKEATSEHSLVFALDLGASAPREKRFEYSDPVAINVVDGKIPKGEAPTVPEAPEALRAVSLIAWTQGATLHTECCKLVLIHV